MQFAHILILTLIPVALAAEDYDSAHSSHGFGGGRGGRRGRGTGESRFDAYKKGGDYLRYNAAGDLSGDVDADLSGNFNKFGLGSDSDQYDKSASYGLRGKSSNDEDYGINGKLYAKGKFLAKGNEDKGSKYAQVTEFRKGASFDGYGMPKKQYNDYETYGKMKRYGDKNYVSDFDVKGKVKAKGKFDAVGKDDLYGDLAAYGKYVDTGKSKDGSKYDEKAKYKGYGKGKMYGKVRGHGDREGRFKAGRHVTGHGEELYDY